VWQENAFIFADRRLTLIHLSLSTGERLPCLVDAKTWLPVKLATRWAVTYRRQRVQASTLTNDLFILGKLYTWAWEIGGYDLDAQLLQGILPDARQLESLVAYLREQGQPKGEAKIISPNTVNKYLGAIENFLVWSLDCAQPALSLEQRQGRAWQLAVTCRSLRYRGHPSQRKRPLSEIEVAAIRASLAPQRDSAGDWHFPENGFTPGNALRNWLMVEMALQLGLRLGELLKVRLDSLPRGGQKALLIRRHPDDIHDTRRHEPAVKTAERGLPVSDPLLAIIRHYVTGRPPYGRKSGRSPYLFVTDEGQPLSIGRAQDIIQIVGSWSGIEQLSWHRLRHTWAEQLAAYLLETPNGRDQLMYLGGWTNPQSPQRYIQDAVAEQAQATLRAWQESLYDPAMRTGA
jgi:integrase